MMKTLNLSVAVALGLASCATSDDATDNSTAAPVSTEPVAADTTPPLDDSTSETASRSSAPDSEEAASTSSTPDDPADDSTPPVFPRTIEHALGSTEIDDVPLRIVTLDRSLTDPVLALELELVGYTTFQDPNGSLPEYFGDGLENASEAQWVGDLLEPNLEAILATNPDLIISSRVRHEALYDQLSQIAPTIMSESGGGGWKDNVRLVGEATGREDVAEALLADYESRAADIGERINQVADSPTISVVRFLGDIRLYQPVSFSGTVLADAGLMRPESQQNQEEFILEISEEELLLADADHLFFTVFDREDAADAFTDLEARPLWQSLTAVQEGNAHPVLDDLWMSGVGLFGAHAILDDLAAVFEV